jgi:hypothetical protein
MFYQEFTKGLDSSKSNSNEGSQGYSYPPPSTYIHRVDVQAQDGTRDIVDNTQLYKLQVQSLTEKPPKLTLDQSKIQVALNTLNLITPKHYTSRNGTARASESGRALRSATNLVSSKLNLPPPDYTYMKDGNYYHIHDLRREKGVYGGPKWLSSMNDDFENAILSLLGLGPPGRLIKPTFTVCSQQYMISAFVRFAYKYLF